MGFIVLLWLGKGTPPCDRGSEGVNLVGDEGAFAFCVEQVRFVALDDFVEFFAEFVLDFGDCELAGVGFDESDFDFCPGVAFVVFGVDLEEVEGVFHLRTPGWEGDSPL